MASLDGLQIFLNELDKGHKRSVDANRAADEAQREKLNMDFKAAQSGLKITENSQTGKLEFSKLSAEENVVMQGKLENVRALEEAKADISNTIRGKQTVADVEFAASEPAKDLEEIERGKRLESDEEARQKQTLDIQSQVESRVETLESDAGKKLSELERQKIEDEITTKVKAQAKALVSPEVVEAQKQAELNKLLIQTSPEAIKARQQLFDERLIQKKAEFEQDLVSRQKLSAQEVAFKLKQFDDVRNELSTFTNTVDIIQASKAYEAILGVPPGTFNPITIQEQLRMVEERKEEREFGKAAQAAQIATALDPIITEALAGENVDIDDLTDEDDLNELVGDPALTGSNKTIDTTQLRNMIRTISQSSSISEKQVAKAVLAKLGVKINSALDDVLAGDFFKTKAEEVRVARKLTTLRDTLRRIAGVKIKNKRPKDKTK
jgi:hypothetical protein